MPGPEELITVRIPELTIAGNEVHPLTLDDQIPVWQAEDNKTRHTTLSKLREFVATGGGASFAPVYTGGKVIYIATQDDEDNQRTTISIPSLAGQSFTASRDGQPLLPGTEYEVLNAGGLKLKIAGDFLLAGQRFELDVFTLQGAQQSPVASGGNGSLVNGKVIVSTNLTMTAANHLNKIIQIRAGSNKVVLTLPNLEDIPSNTIIIIETAITNDYQAGIQTQAGQFIYFLNSSRNTLYMGKGESLWLYRDDDGFYIINDFAQVYERVGKVDNSYKAGINEIVADGSLLQRDEFPRLWEFVQTLGASLVSETTWQTASVTVQGREVLRPYRGCYSTGDGSGNFRIPNLLNVALRGVRSLVGTDPERYSNTVGVFQRNDNESHNHVEGPWNKASARASDLDGTNTAGDVDATNPTTEYRVTGISTPMWTLATIKPSGGTEARMDNVAVKFTIKV